MTMTELPDWHVDIDGCHNFRDAGGWPLDTGGTMRLGALYRSDDPIRITERGRRSVEAMGLAAVVDLRQDAQVRRAPGFLPADRTLHIALTDRVIDPAAPPVLEVAHDMADLYTRMLDGSREPLARAIDAVAASLQVGPVLVHCAYGKDRAGLVTALVHAAIGVTKESIVADYARSDEPSQRRFAHVAATPLPDDPDTSAVPALLFRAPGAAMDVLLDRMIDQHGSLTAWAAALPVDPSTIAGLRAALVEH